MNQSHFNQSFEGGLNSSMRANRAPAGEDYQPKTNQNVSNYTSREAYEGPKSNNNSAAANKSS